MRVFISHGMADVAFANRVRTELDSLGFLVWNPDRELFPGDNWLLEAGHALENADAVVFLFSADSVDSTFAKREIAYVIAQRKFEHRVIPVRVGRKVGKIPWVFRDLVIDAPQSNARSAAREIANRLEPMKPVRKPASKRRATALSKTKVGKRTTQRVRRASSAR